MNAFRHLRLPLCVALASVALTLAPGCKKGPTVEALSEEQASDPTALFQQGVRYLKTPDPKTGEVDYVSAYDHFVRASELRPEPKVSFNAGWTAEQMGELEKAERHYRKAYEADPAYDRAMFSLTRVLTEIGKGEEVASMYQAYLERNPDEMDVRYDYMQALTDLGQYEEAEKQARQILRDDPKNAGAYRALSSMYFAQGRLGLAQLCNEKALEINDGDPGIYNNMGVTYVLQADAERAIERFQKAVKLNPSHFEANMNLGYIALDSGDYGLALDAFKKATSTQPNNRDAKLGLAVALRGNGEYDEADKLYREIIQADPKFKTAYFNASIMHERYTRDFKTAQKYLDEFIAAHVGEIGPNHEVYERKTRIEASIEEERKRQEAIAAEEKARKEREERNKQLLADLKAEVTRAKTRLAECQDPATSEEAGMYLEQVELGMDDASMAGDLKTFVDQVHTMLDACLEGGGGTEEPAEGGGTEEPTEQGGTEEPAEE